MPDRTIPFYNTILRCDGNTPKEVTLPDGFSVIPYRDGFEKGWARLEYAVGDFAGEAEAERYFVSTDLEDRRKSGAYDDTEDGSPMQIVCPLSFFHRKIAKRLTSGGIYGIIRKKSVRRLKNEKERNPLERKRLDDPAGCRCGKASS